MKIYFSKSSVVLTQKVEILLPHNYHIIQAYTYPKNYVTYYRYISLSPYLSYYFVAVTGHHDQSNLQIIIEFIGAQNSEGGSTDIMAKHQTDSNRS